MLFRFGLFLLSYGTRRVCAFLLFLTLLVLFGTHQAAATSDDTAKDTLVFVNGDRLTGQFIAATKTSVEFKGKVTGALDFAWSDIKELRLIGATMEVSRNVSVDKNTPKNFTVTEPVIENNGTDLVFRRQSADSREEPQARQVPLAELVSAAPTKQARWRGSIQSQDSLIGATLKQYQLGATMHLSRATQAQIQASSDQHQP
jgi:hypothetical protein